MTKPAEIEKAADDLERFSVDIGEEGGNVDLIALTDEKDEVMPSWWLTDAQQREKKKVNEVV